MERLVEICCGSYEDALNAYYGKAKRIELNSALHLGGLTPSIASLKLTKKNTNLKIITMIRPRGAGFCYNDIEFEVMKEDARCMLENKADGIAFGCLNQDGSINEKQTKEMIDIIKEYQGEVVFHRAFDCVADPYASIELLIHLGVDRILTSGLKPKAMDGKELIKDLQNKFFRHRIKKNPCKAFTLHRESHSFYNRYYLTSFQNERILSSHMALYEHLPVHNRFL